MFKFLVLVTIVLLIVHYWKKHKIDLCYVEGKGLVISYDVRKDGKFVRREQYIINI